MNLDFIINLVCVFIMFYVGVYVIYEGIEFKIWLCKKGNEFFFCFEFGKIFSIDVFGVIVKISDVSVILINYELLNVFKEGDYLG